MADEVYYRIKDAQHEIEGLKNTISALEKRGFKVEGEIPVLRHEANKILALVTTTLRVLLGQVGGDS